MVSGGGNRKEEFRVTLASAVAVLGLCTIAYGCWAAEPKLRLVSCLSGVGAWGAVVFYILGIAIWGIRFVTWLGVMASVWAGTWAWTMSQGAVMAGIVLLAGWAGEVLASREPVPESTDHESDKAKAAGPAPPPGVPPPKLLGGAPAALPILAGAIDSDSVDHGIEPDRDPLPEPPPVIVQAPQVVSDELPGALAIVRALPSRARYVHSGEECQQAATLILSAVVQWAPLPAGASPQIQCVDSTPQGARFALYPGVQLGPPLLTYVAELERVVPHVAGALGLQGEKAARLSLCHPPGSPALEFTLAPSEVPAPGLREVLLSRAFLRAVANGAFVLPAGETFDGQLVTFDLGDHPHALVGGPTGSGKTAYARILILVVLIVYPGSEVVIIDPKGDDFNDFDGLPGVRYYNVSENPSRASEIAQELSKERQQKQAKFTELKKRYGSLAKAKAAGERVYRTVVFAEELTELVEAGPANGAPPIAVSLGSQARVGRSAWWHIIGLIQRPDARLLPTEIKDNLAVRIGIGALSKQAKDMIFGSSAGQITWRAVGKGDAACMWPGIAVTRVRTPYHDEDQNTLLCRKYRRVQARTAAAE